MIPAVYLAFAAHSALAMPAIVSVSPQDQSQVAPQNLQVVVRFAAAVDPATVNLKSFHVLSKWAGALAGTFAFEDANKTVRFTSTTAVAVGELVRVNLSKAISGTGGPSAYFWEFWTATGRVPAMTFTNLKTIRVRQSGETVLLRTYGAFAGDLNHDGWEDLSVVNEDAGDVRVYLGDKQGGFAEPPAKVGIQAGTAPSTNEGADFNLDGHMDFAVGQIQGSAVSVLFGDGTGKLTLNASYPVGGGGTGRGTRGLCALDLNGDNYYDLVSANRIGNNVSILINNGSAGPGTFKAAVNMEATVAGETSCASGDFNKDGFEDVAVGGYTDSSMVILLSDGSGTLRVGSKQTTHSPWMNQTGDFDNDGNLDVIAVNNLRSNFSLLRGDGKGNLAKSETYTVGSGVGSAYASLAIEGGDLNGDGNLDVITSNFSNGSWTLYLGIGAGRFGNRSELRTQTAGSDATLHDRDRDGDLDITGIDEEADLIQVFNNVGTPIAVNPFQISLPNLRDLRYDPIRKAFVFDLLSPARLRVEILGTDGRMVQTLSRRNFPSGRQALTLSTPPSAGVRWIRLIQDNQVLQAGFATLP